MEESFQDIKKKLKKWKKSTILRFLKKISPATGVAENCNLAELIDTLQEFEISKIYELGRRKNERRKLLQSK